MQVLVFVALLQTYACKPPPKQRSVNLALETIVEFDNNENSADVQIIDKVRTFLDRVKHVIGNKPGYRRNMPNEKIQFTDFVKETLGILSQYEDSDLEDVLTIVDEEMRKYHYKGCKFHELLENYHTRRFITDNLEKIKNAPAKTVKEQLRKMLNTFENKNFNLMQKVIMEHVNNLYGHNSDDKFRIVLDQLTSYGSKTKRTNLNLVQIVRNGIRSLIFDHYSALDPKTRRALKLKLETFWNNLAHPERNRHDVWQFKPSVKLDISNENYEGDDDEDDGNLEIPARETIQREHERQSQEIKAKRQKDKHSTRKRLTFITLYPEAITVLDKKRHRTKPSKSNKLPTRIREDKHKIRSSKKNQAVKRIVTEHEAVINVEKHAAKYVFTAIDEVLGRTPSEISKTTTRRPRKMRNRYQTAKRASNYNRYKNRNKRRRHHLKKFRNPKNIPTFESEEGLSIKSFENSDLNKRSFRKSNLNDSLNLNETTTIKITNNLVSSTPVPVNVIKRINALENELKSVKAQIKITSDDSYEPPPQYDPLDFWEGTTKHENITTTELTTQTTKTTTILSTTTTTTTTTKPKTTKTATTTKLTTKVVTNSSGAVFRTKVNESDVEKKVLKQQEKMAPEKQEKMAPQKKEETPRNITGVKPMSHSNIANTIKLNQSAEIDYLNDLQAPKTNLTGIEDIERYLNETKPIGDDKKHEIVRKMMLEQLKGLFSKNPEEEFNSSVIFPTTPMLLNVDQDETTDPFNFFDVGDDNI